MNNYIYAYIYISIYMYHMYLSDFIGMCNRSYVCDTSSSVSIHPPGPDTLGSVNRGASW